MDSATEEHFQKLDECVEDDNNIVTVPSLSRLLNIPLTDSQLLLSKYVKEQRKLKSNELFLTYVLTGIITDSGKAVVIVKESDLAEKKTTFVKVESEVLFSVQKCKTIDFNVLSLVDDVTQANKAPLLGSIVSKNCIKRVLKVKQLAAPPPATIKGKSSFFLPKTESSIKTEKSSEPVAKTKDKSKGNGIGNMFDKAAVQANKANIEKKSSFGSTKNKQKNGLSAFFSKSASTSNSSLKSETSTKTEISTDNESLPNGLEELMEVDFQELDEVENKIKKEEIEMKEDIHIVIEEKQVKEEKKKGTKKSEGKEKKIKNKRQREKSEEKSLKKRKRIIQRNDSESDDMFENDDEDIIEKSDNEIERAPSPVATKKPLAPKNKIRKAVDKTYMDDEGFIVTKTEYAYESAPEDVEEVPIKKEIAEKSKLEKKTSASSENDVSPVKGTKGKKGKKNNLQNQPTLMNFFKKK